MGGRTLGTALAALERGGVCVTLGVSAAAEVTFDTRQFFVTGRPRWRYLWAGLLFVPPTVGEAKGFFLLLPAGVLAIVPRLAALRPGRTAAAVVFLAACLAVAVVAFGRVGGQSDLTRVLRDPTVIRAALGPPRTASAHAERNPVDVTLAAAAWSRLSGLLDAWSRVSVSPARLALGFGLGSRTRTHEEILAGAPYYRSPVATKLYELGCVGLALYWLVFHRLLRSVRPLRDSGERFWQALALAFPGIVATYLITDFYTDHSHDIPAFTFWLVAAALVSRAEADRAPTPPGSG